MVTRRKPMVAVEPGSFEPPPPVVRAIDKPKPYLVVRLEGAPVVVTPHLRRRLSFAELRAIDDALARAGDTLDAPLPADGSAGLWVAPDGTVTPAPALHPAWLKRLLQDFATVACVWGSKAAGKESPGLRLR